MPLTLIQGIDLYDLTRLGDEGITNVEALAHHDLVDLMLKTRIPAPRLVDWVDQAILVLHTFVGDADDGEGRGLLHSLRSHGIRSATDLLKVCKKPGERDKAAQSVTSADPQRLQMVLRAMEDDEWLRQIRHWRNEEASQESAPLEIRLDAIPA